MSMDIPLQRPLGTGGDLNTQSPGGNAANGPQPGPKSSRALGAHDPNGISAADRTAARIKALATLKAMVQDGMDTAQDAKNARQTAPKSKLTANPFALSPEAEARIRSNPNAGPILPPPPAHVRPATPAQRKTFVERFTMRSPQAAAVGAAGAATAAAVGAPEAVRAAIESSTPEGLTPEEAGYVKKLVGKAPPAVLIATAPNSDDAIGQDASTKVDAAAAGVKSTDSLASIQKVATTYVPWQQFFAALTKRQQAALSVWLLQRQKLQLLSAAITIGMLETDKQLQINNIAMERVETTLSFMRAIEQSKNSATIGLMRPLKNSGLSVMRSSSDIQSSQNQNNDVAPAQDLHRMALLRKIVGQSNAPNSIYNRYYENVGHLGFEKAPKTSSLTVPRADAGPDDMSVHLDRSLLSDQEVKKLTSLAAQKYADAKIEMLETRGQDWPAMVGLFEHEAALCRGASALHQAVAANYAPGSTEHATAMGHAKEWAERAENIQAQGQQWQDKLQSRAATVMHDENRYGDMLRERSALTQKRQDIENMLHDTKSAPDAEQRQHLERVRMNIDWRAIALDRELGRHSNPTADNRLDRWHTGAKNIADGFYTAHMSRTDSQAAHPDLQWNTMASVAPVGATALNSAYIRAVENLRGGKTLVNMTAADFPGLDLKSIDKAQMSRHIADRKNALSRYAQEDKDVSTPQKATLATFHAAEREHLAAVEYFFKNQKVLPNATPSGWPIPKSVATAFTLNKPYTPRALKRAPITFKDETPEKHRATAADAVPADIALDPAKAAEYYRQRAAAGAAVMGSGGDPNAAGYQNKVFELLNRVSDAALFINFDALDRAATESAMGNTQDIIGEASQKFSEVFGEMAQERRMIEAANVQLIDSTYKVAT